MTSKETRQPILNFYRDLLMFDNARSDFVDKIAFLTSDMRSQHRDRSRPAGQVRFGLWLVVFFGMLLAVAVAGPITAPANRTLLAAEMSTTITATSTTEEDSDLTSTMEHSGALNAEDNHRDGGQQQHDDSDEDEDDDDDVRDSERTKNVVVAAVPILLGVFTVVLMCVFMFCCRRNSRRKQQLKYAIRQHRACMRPSPLDSDMSDNNSACEEATPADYQTRRTMSSTAASVPDVMIVIGPRQMQSMLAAAQSDDVPASAPPPLPPDDLPPSYDEVMRGCVPPPVSEQRPSAPPQIH